jgi:Ca2+-binding RTX toxin-like protein
MALFEGTPGNDSITGTSLDDAIAGLAGSDTLIGLGDNDVLDGGEGSDTVVLQGNKLDYQFSLEIGQDFNTFRQLVSVDTVASRDATDSMINTEHIRFADGAVRWHDVPIYMTVADNVHPDQPIDLFAGTMNDTLVGHDGINMLSGGLGDDSIDGGAGLSDWAMYQAFNSHVVMQPVVGAIVADLTTGLVTGAWGNDTLVGVEGIIGSNYDDLLTGNDLGNTFIGEAGNDTLIGGGGADGLQGDEGANLINGGDGNDTIYGANGETTAVYRGDLETYTLSLITGPTFGFYLTDSEIDRDGKDWLDQVDMIQFADDTVAAELLVDILGNTITGNAGSQTISGSIYKDLITGAGGNDTIIGNGGLDWSFYDGDMSRYTIGESGEYRTVSDTQFTNGNDSLNGVERIQFGDMGIAYDLDGNAGAAARLIGVLFGGDKVYDPGYMRVVMGAFDYGYSAELIATVAIDYMYPDINPRGFALTVYYNLGAPPPTEDQITFLTDLIGQHSMAWLTVAVGNTIYTENIIDFTGLVENGVQFLPPV